MNIFLLGNGFDLHYLLPTNYADFLNTIEYLCHHKNDSVSNVGYVFRELSIEENNKRICDSYNKYRNCYHSTALSNDEVAELIGTAEKNKWFQYFVKCKIKGNGWIDFEKEIKKVLELIEESFYIVSSSARKFSMCGDVPLTIQSDVHTVLDTFELGVFQRFLESELGENIIPDDMNSFYLAFSSDYFIFRDDLYFDYQEGAEKWELIKDAIVNEILLSLREFTRLLSMYLNTFVERPLEFFHKEGVVDLDEIFKSEAVVVSLNYTNTFEALYYDPNTARKTIMHNGVALPRICHIHGTTNSSIVLGIDSDVKDELNELDTRFISFKKYYQRVIYKTDNDYLSLLQKTSKEQNKEYDLFVFGHSLDVTDRDIIIELFDLANTITIYYHSQSELENYVRRLVSIYGKKEFDQIRVSKELTFFHTDNLNINERILLQNQIASMT